MPDVNLGRSGGPFSFDRGLDDVIYKRRDPSQAQFVMPDQRLLAPVEERRRPQLDELLTQRTLESLVDEAILPEVLDAQLLLPGPFREARRRALASIRRKADSLREFSPEEARVLQRAIRILVEEEDLQELMQMYRSSLYQG